jgi:hypothetical protein
MATIASPVSARLKSDRIFYTSMGLAIAAIVFAGFARSYYLSYWIPTPQGFRELDGLLHFHAAFFSAWVVLMVVQPMLIASRNVPLHRTLGYAGAAIAAAMFVVGHVASVAAMHGGFIGMGDPLAFYVIPFMAINSFGLFAALAIYFRNRAETHKRLILLANVPLLEASIARIPLDMIVAGAPFSFIFGPNILIVAGMIYDWRTRGKIHRVWIWGGLATLALQVIRFPLMGSALWQEFAARMAILWV